MLYLIGFMGVGKTTIGRELATNHNVNFIDTDEEIEKKSNNSILEIFQKNNENYFRKVESIILQKINKGTIVACGGGLPIYNNNMDFIKKTGVSIYLKASKQEIFNRINNNFSRRPLLINKSNKEIKHYIQNTLVKREKFYEMADYIVDTSDLSKKDVLREIDTLPFRI